MGQKGLESRESKGTICIFEETGPDCIVARCLTRSKQFRVVQTQVRERVKGEARLSWFVRKLGVCVGRERDRERERKKRETEGGTSLNNYLHMSVHLSLVA